MRRLKKTVLDNWLIQTLGVLVIFPPLILAIAPIVIVWDIAKWPILLVIISLMFSLLYWACPNVRQPGFKWITPGGVLAVVIWLIASALFALYVKFFPNNKTYGSFGGVIVFLVWLWISNIAVLFGQEMNAELERQRELDAGLPAKEEIQLPPRAVPKEG